MKRQKNIFLFGIILSIIMIFSSCTGDNSNQDGTFESGDCIVTTFDSGEAEKGSDFAIDYSGLKKGYVGVKASKNFDKLVFQVSFDGTKQNYWFDNDNQTLFIPLSDGAGTYTFTILKNITGDKYSTLYSTQKSVTLEDEFQPFIRSNSMVNYSENSEAVKEAKRLAGSVDTDSEFVEKIYKYIEKKVDYDGEFADSDPDMYYPNLDATLDSGKGICFDYAALAAGMLRSQGIPTKLITGYVNLDGEVYHAWNMVYLKNKGWITVKISASPDDWNQVDITMDDTGDVSSLQKDSYTQRYVY